MIPNPHLAALKSRERRRQLRRRRGRNPSTHVFLQIVDDGRAVRNLSDEPIPCQLIVEWEALQRLDIDVLAPIPPAGCDYLLPSGARVLAVMPHGATQEDMIRKLKRLGFASLGEIDPAIVAAANGDAGEAMRRAGMVPS